MSTENPQNTPQSDDPPPYEQVVAASDDELPPSYDAIFPPEEEGHQVSLLPLEVIQESGVQTENNNSTRETFLQSVTNHILSSCVGKQFPSPDRLSRKKFARNVYGIVSVQILTVTLLLSTKLLYITAWFFGATFFAVLNFIYCSTSCYFILKKLTTSEYNFCLALQTVSIAVFLGMFPKPKTVLLSVEITAITCVSLTVFATVSSTTGGFLLVIGIIVVAFVFMMFTLGDVFSPLHLGYACLAAMLFSTFLVYDVQLMVMGKHRNSASISWEDYVYGACTIHGDLIRKLIIMIPLLVILIMVIWCLSDL